MNVESKTVHPYPNKDHVIIITTGGTIEKTYDEVEGSLMNRESIVKQMILSRLRLPYTNLNVFSILHKDSLDFTDGDRELLLNSIKAQSQMGLPIVVLHGTDTMTESAEYIQKGLDELNVPVIFTGAMRPMGFENSDATQNVTESLLAAKLLGAGVYLCFHNRIYTVPGVRKNKLVRTFETF